METCPAFYTAMSSTIINTKYLDTIVAGVIWAALFVSVLILLNAYIDGENLGAWVWQRHQNQFSWYSRPLFIIPACYYAYRQKLWFIIGFMLLLGCSLFWFAAPEHVAEHVVQFLDWEKRLFFTNDSVFPLLLLTIAVVIFLFGLFSALWHRNLWIGLLLINVGTIMKILVSVFYGKEVGEAAIVPSLSSLILINLTAFMLWRNAIKKANLN